MIVDPIVISAGLLLRPLSESEGGEKYASWLNDPEVNQFLEARFRTWTPDDLGPYIKEMNESQNNIHMGIFLQSEHVGNISIRNYTPEHKRAEIAFLIGEKSLWGKGIGTSSVKALSSHAFASLDLHKLWAGCYAKNIGSYKCLQRAGFEKEAVLDGWFSCDGMPTKSVFLSKKR